MGGASAWCACALLDVSLGGRGGELICDVRRDETPVTWFQLPPTARQRQKGGQVPEDVHAMGDQSFVFAD